MNEMLMMNKSEKHNQQGMASLKTRWKQVRQELGRSVFNAEKWVNLWAELTPVEFNPETQTLTLKSTRGRITYFLKHAFLFYAIEKAFGQGTTVMMKVPEGQDLILAEESMTLKGLHESYSATLKRWKRRAEDNTPLNADFISRGLMNYMMTEEANAYSAKETLEMLQQLTPILLDDHFVYILQGPAQLLRDRKAMRWLTQVVLPHDHYGEMEFYCDEPLYSSLEERWEKMMAEVKRQLLHPSQCFDLSQIEPVSLAGNQLTVKAVSYQAFLQLKENCFLLYKLAQEFGEEMVLLADHPTATGRTVSYIDTRWITDPKTEEMLSKFKARQKEFIDEVDELIRNGEGFGECDWRCGFANRRLTPQQAKQVMESIELVYCNPNHLGIARINDENLDSWDDTDYALHEMMSLRMLQFGAYTYLIRE